MNVERLRGVARWIAQKVGALLALLATLAVLWIFFVLLGGTRQGLFSDAASSVSGAPGP